MKYQRTFCPLPILLVNEVFDRRPVSLQEMRLLLHKKLLYPSLKKLIPFFLFTETKLLSDLVMRAVQIRQSKGLFATTNRFTFIKTKTYHEKYRHTCS
jgi:hypothetical protein